MERYELNIVCHLNAKKNDVNLENVKRNKFANAISYIREP